MKKIGRFLLNWVWQFPQMLLGYIMSRLWKTRLINLSDREKEFLYGLEELTGYKIYIADYYSHKADKALSFISGFSMGRYICLNSAHDLMTLRHEKGHTVQSAYLGWFYLPIVGIYSAVFCNMWQRWYHQDWNEYDLIYWYYMTRWSESWADNEGGVDRIAALRKIYRPENARFPEV